MSSNTPPSTDDPALAPEDGGSAPPAICVMVFNANDPSGAGGLAADIAAVASVGGHPVPVVTGSYVRDSAEVFDQYTLSAMFWTIRLNVVG